MTKTSTSDLSPLVLLTHQRLTLGMDLTDSTLAFQTDGS